MAAQNYKNHKKSYPAHHFIFYPIILLLIAVGIRHSMKFEEQRALWIFLTIVVAMLGWLSFMVRQHYGMTLQDRIILTELRYRYFVLTGERFEPLEAQLSKGQLFAVRFAPDEEFLALVQKAIAENLSSDAIKRSIINWKADNGRV
jgi:hypothetical protein